MSFVPECRRVPPKAVPTLAALGDHQKKQSSFTPVLVYGKPTSAIGVGHTR
jgi:hypothetical protein